MADSDFWRNLAEKFTELNTGDFFLYVAAEKGTELNRTSSWGLISKGDVGLSCSAGYDALARRGAMKLPDRGSDLLDKWLNAIENRIPQAVVQHAGGRHIPHLLLHSANLCRMFESAALEAEYRAAEPFPEQSGESQETIAQQLNRLRMECRITAEELAEELEVEVRSVYRHLAGRAIPRKRHIRGYERIFSKALKRQVVIG